MAAKDWTKMPVEHKWCQRVTNGPLNIVSGLEIDKDFHQFWGKTVALVGSVLNHYEEHKNITYLLTDLPFDDEWNDKRINFSHILLQPLAVLAAWNLPR